MPPHRNDKQKPTYDRNHRSVSLFCAPSPFWGGFHSSVPVGASRCPAIAASLAAVHMAMTIVPSAIPISVMGRAVITIPVAFSGVAFFLGRPSRGSRRAFFLGVVSRLTALLFRFSSQGFLEPGNAKANRQDSQPKFHTRPSDRHILEKPAAYPPYPGTMTPVVAASASKVLRARKRAVGYRARKSSTPATLVRP